MFTRLRLMNRVRDEFLAGIAAGHDGETAAQAALDKLEAEFVKPGDPQSAIDWATILPIIIQLLTMFLKFFPPKV